MSRMQDVSCEWLAMSLSEQDIGSIAELGAHRCMDMSHSRKHLPLRESGEQVTALSWWATRKTCCVGGHFCCRKKKKNLFWFWIVWTITQNRQGNRVLCKTNSRSDFNWMIASGLWPESPTTTSYISRDKQGYKWIVLAVLCLCLYIEKRKTLFGQNKDTYVFIYSAIYVTCLFCITQDG